MSTTNAYCKALGIQVPRLEAVRTHPDANYYSFLIVTLLERGEPITLEEAAMRFEEAGVAPAHEAVASLKRCKPARPPIYRDGDHYTLDPHDDEADLWAFRLGLRPPRVAAPQVVRPDSNSLPSPDRPLTVADLDEAWRDGVPNTWSAQRIAIAVLDAHRSAMRPDDVLAFVHARSQWSPLSTDSATYWRRGAAIRVCDDKRWALDGEHDAVRSARQALRDRIAMIRRWAHMRSDPAVIDANRKRIDRAREAHAKRLGRMPRVLIHAFPAKRPEAAVLVDVASREITTFIGEEISLAKSQIADYEVIGAVDVRALLRVLNVEPGERRLAELGPPQRTRQLNKRGRTLKITTRLLVQGSCGITRPFGDDRVLRRYLRDGEYRKLRRRLEADAKSLFALYQYGRLHGAVRLRWGFLDEMQSAPWVHRDEPTLYDLMKRAHGLRVPLQVVVGRAPGWADPWSRARRAHVETDEWGSPAWLVDEEGSAIDEADVQLARLPSED